MTQPLIRNDMYFNEWEQEKRRQLKNTIYDFIVSMFIIIITASILLIIIGIVLGWYFITKFW